MAGRPLRERARLWPGSASDGNRNGSSSVSLSLCASGPFSPAAGFAKYAERLTDGAFENRPIWITARQNAQPHHRCQEQSRGISRVDVRRYAAVALACDNASAKECLQFAHALRHDRGNVRIMRRHFQRRIGQEATETAFERALNDLGQERFRSPDVAEASSPRAQCAPAYWRPDSDQGIA